MPESKPVHFISYPSSNSVNPFIRLLNDALASKGYQEVKDINLLYSFKNALKYRDNVKILHFHWPESLWRTNYFLLSIIKSIRFIIAVYFLRSLGYKLVFSAHNVIPHFGKINVGLEKRMRRFILKHFDLTIGHSYLTYQELKSTYNIKPRNYVLALHGLYYNYLSLSGKHYDNIARSEKIKLYLQYSKNEYKGSARFLDLFGELPQDIKSNFCLVLSGDKNSDITKKISENGITYVWIDEETQNKGYLSDEELVGIIKAVDFVVLPYKKITTSGAYFLALTFNKKVLATNLPFFKAHSTEQIAVLYDGSLHSLQAGLKRVIDEWPAPDIGKQLDQFKQQFSWDQSANNIAQAYGELIKS
jgi:beta-1,4-mannosyltransferase